MQRLAGDFLVKRSVMVYDKSGNTAEIYELPNGQWQFGKGRDAVVITDMGQIEHIAGSIDANTKATIAAWVEKIKNRPTPEAVQQGQTPLLEGVSARDRLSTAISRMSDEVANRLLLAIESTLGPVADSLSQEAQANHHGGHYGDPGAHAPATTGFTLPEGSKWADPQNPASGYLSPDYQIKDERGQPTMRWHPTPEFNAVVEASSDGRSPVEVEMDEERQKHQEREPVGAGRTSARRRR